MRTSAIAVIIVAASGCATVYTNGTTQRIEVTSTPPSAEVFLDGQFVGTTPLEVDVSRHSRDPVIRVKKDGFRENVRRFQRRTSRWIWPNIASGAILGLVGGILLQSCDECGRSRLVTLGVGAMPMLMDFGTGAAYEFTPQRIDAALAPSGRWRPIDRMEVPEYMRRQPSRSTTPGVAPTVGDQR